MKKCALFTVALLAVVAAGCSAPTGHTRVAFVTNNPSDFWDIAEAGTEEAAEELNVDVIFRKPPNGTAEEQQQILEDLITQGVSGVAISPVDPENQTAMLNEAAEQVHLITQDSDAPESDRLCYLGTNNYEAGRAAGELILEALPEGGEVMIFVGSADAQNAQDRRQGILDVLEGAEVSVIDTLTDETDRAKAVSNVEDTLVTYPEVDCLVGLWSYNGPAILTGVENSQKLGQVEIVCFDEEDKTLQGVKDGHIYATVVQQPYKFGYESVKLLAQLAEGNDDVLPDDEVIYIPVKRITQDNVDAFWAQLKELRGEG